MNFRGGAMMDDELREGKRGRGGREHNGDVESDGHWTCKLTAGEGREGGDHTRLGSIHK